MDQEELQKFEAFKKIMEPLTRRYVKDGIATEDLREEIRLQRDRLEKIDDLSAEQVKEKLEVTLANGARAFLSRFDPVNMSESDLWEAMEKYGCSSEDLAKIHDAMQGMLSSRIDNLTRNIHDSSPEEVKNKIVGMMSHMRTI